MNTYPSDFSVKSCISSAWKLVGGTKLTFFPVWVLFFLGNIFLNMLVDPDSSKVFSFVLSLVLSIFLLMLVWGASYMGIRRASGDNISFGMVRRGFDLILFLKMVALGLMRTLPFVIVFILTQIAIFFLRQHTEIDSIVKILVAFIYIFQFILLIYYIHFMIRVSLAQLILIDTGCGPWSALVQSYRATKSHVLQIVGVMLFSLFTIILGMMTLGIGLIWAIPLLEINMGMIYHKLVSQKK